MSGDFETLRDSGSSDDNQLVRLLEEKIKSLQIEIENLRKELNYYKAEMDKMLSPPLIEATVLDVLPDGRILVRSSSGPNLIVNVASHIDQSLIKPGRSVALNQRGSTILEVLPQKEDPIIKSMEITEKPNIHYSDIGGLNEQIRELKEVIDLPLNKPEIFR